MGIQGLLPQLKSIMIPIHIQDLKGQTVAVDTYSWLHKGALSCSTNLCKGIPTSRHIDYCMHRVNLLRHHGVRPILIFDGGFLPMKTDQETKRARSRKENLERAMEHEVAGNSTAAYECYQKAVDISPMIALGLIKVLKQENVDYIVAPYEADAQMTYLCMNNHVDAVITEDSDLIPFGCCRIIFKMDKYGQGVQFQSSLLGKNKELDFSSFSKQMLLEMCILSGCDYLQSLPGMGLKRAYALIQKFKSYEKVIKHLKYSSVSMPPFYEQNFKKAIWAFQHQRVYDPIKEEIVHLSDVPSDIGEEELNFLGPWLAPYVVKGIAKGELDPFTKLPFQVEESSEDIKAEKLHPKTEPVSASRKRRLDLPVQKNILTNYFCLASLEAKRKFRAPKVIPKRATTKSSPTFEKLESSSPDSTKEATPVDNLKDLDNDLTEKVSFISHQKRFKSPEIMPNSDESKTPDTNTDGTPIPTIDHQTTEFCAGDVGYLPSDDSMEGLSSCKERESVGLPLEGDLFSSPDSSVLLKSENNCLRQFSTPNSEQGYNVNAAIKGNFASGEESNGNTTKGEVIKRSPYFLNNSLDKDNTGSENEGSCINENMNEAIADQTVAAAPLVRKLQIATKRRKLLHPHKETNSSKNFQVSSDDAAEKSRNKTREGNIACDVSHVNKYSGIAEKSMDRFVELIESFRYSGSRASGLRRPLKDVLNTCPVRSTVKPNNLRRHTNKSKNKLI